MVGVGAVMVGVEGRRRVSGVVAVGRRRVGGVGSA